MSDTISSAESTPGSVPAERVVMPVPAAPAAQQTERPVLDPTRYGDWEKNGRCIDF